ncbi:MAG: NADPH:quinone reductase-like Zn-dependent oxidoreductase [Phenylobacterium sp.]|jgi:NADPH:quinone reductase-like Zn-dependent oxidoreductase
MKAIVMTKYGGADGLVLKTLNKPVPGDNDILIKVHATTVFQGDCEIRRCQFNSPLFWLPVRLYLGLFKPRGNTVLGQEFGGEVESVGKAVSQFVKGDAVFGLADLRAGAYAEYICLSDKNLIALKPANMNFEQAATVPVGGITAYNLLKRANIQVGDQVLVNGAGGSIGTYALQIAKAMGAEVTAIDCAEKLPMLSRIGADHVIDFEQQDFSKNGQSYDVIFDAPGKIAFATAMASLVPNGRYLLANSSLTAALRALRSGDKKVLFESAIDKVADFAALKELIEAGKLTAVIDKRYPLEQMVQAHEYVDSGRKQGHVVITVGHGECTIDLVVLASWQTHNR